MGSSLVYKLPWLQSVMIFGYFLVTITDTLRLVKIPAAIQLQSRNRNECWLLHGGLQPLYSGPVRSVTHL
jgi:hypothetical protein